MSAIRAHCCIMVTQKGKAVQLSSVRLDILSRVARESAGAIYIQLPFVSYSPVAVQSHKNRQCSSQGI